MKRLTHILLILILLNLIIILALGKIYFRVTFKIEQDSVYKQMVPEKVPCDTLIIKDSI